MTQSTARKICESLEQAILLGEYENGQRLDETSLSATFSVSRTPIREALQLLSGFGLVELRKNRGAFVRFPSFTELLEMFEVMAELEALCGRLASRRATLDTVKQLQQAAQACQLANTIGDTDLYYRENEIFHHLIYELSGNKFLAAESARLHKRLQPFRRLQLKVRNRMQQSMAEHNAILQAIEKGDAEAASIAARDHVSVQGHKVNDLMASYQQ